jgi:uncharacterized protein (DUF1778 family)
MNASDRSDKTVKTVQAHETIKLSAKDSKLFFVALSAPAPINRKLKDAMEEHAQRVVSKG